MTKVQKLIFSLITTLLLLGCADLKQAGKEVGHATRDAATAIGHATRDTTKAIGHASRDAVVSVHDELSQ
ncbi:hypothetical protein HUO09_20320 [Vibrio sp. Y2-5]|uniref:hypothetical protein n=1 Tax=Vibrio TaxID=662 RepID=UPI00142D2301|nr:MULTISPECIES: hypothetical protein [Vibrio]MBD0788700.1 hypothetical protein [Vibrio sp. Y2-5]NIY93213.1 hypothetical protein [Vibrio diazotrophicus]